MLLLVNCKLSSYRMPADAITTHIFCLPLCLQYFSYAVPVTGVVTVKACGKTSFNPTVTIMAEASVEGGSATPVACGTCSKPAM